MKVELIMPVSKKRRLTRTGIYFISNTFAQLAAVTPEHIELKITDENLKEIDYNSGSDLVGIHVLTLNHNRSIEISEKFKERGAKIVWGGCIQQ